jgi:hypothetical protein
MARMVGQKALRVASIAVVAASLVACSRKPAEPAATSAPRMAANTKNASAEPAPPAAIVHGIRKQKNLDVPVFVDGKEVSVLRFGELPSQVQPVDKVLSGRTIHFYRLSDYLAAIGVDVNRVKRVDFAGNRDRVSGVEGSELRADKDRFVFNFLQDTTGSVMQRWDTTGLKNQLRNFEIYAVNVFVDSKPWAVDSAKHCYLEAGASDDSDCKPFVRWTKDDLMKGTRVYADGKLVAYVKRRLLADSVVVDKSDAGEGEAVFSTDKYLASLGIDASKARRVELLHGDDMIASATGHDWVADREKLTFSLQRHSHGKVVAKIPANLQFSPTTATDRDVQVTAIEVFTKTDPRSMPLVSVEDIRDFGDIAEEQQRAFASAQDDGDHERDHQD